MVLYMFVPYIHVHVHHAIQNLKHYVHSLVPRSLLDLYVPGDPREEEGGETNLLSHNIGGKIADGELPIADD